MNIETEKERVKKGYTCSSLEAHMGRDGKHYFFNLYNLMPLQVNPFSKKYLQLR